MMSHAYTVRFAAACADTNGLKRNLNAAADYIEQLERANDELRRLAGVQLSMRVEAQARAARLAKDARR